MSSSSVSLSNTIYVSKEQRSSIIKSIPVESLTWDDLKNQVYTHEFLTPREGDLYNRCFFDIDVKKEGTEEQYNELHTRINQVLEKNAPLYGFVFTDGSYIKENLYKLSYHIVFPGKYIDRSYFTVKFNESQQLVRNALHHLEEDTVNVLLAGLDDSVYKKHCWLRLPYGKQQGKDSIHKPMRNTQPSDYLVSLAPEGKHFWTVGKSEHEDKGDEKEEHENQPRVVATEEDATERTTTMIEMLKMVKKERFQNYAEWFKLLCLMKQNGMTHEDFCRISKESGYRYYSERDCLAKWFQLTERNDAVGFPTLHKWLEEDGVDWKALFCKKKNKMISDLMKAWNTFGTLTDMSIAEIFFAHYKDSLYFTQVGWIHYNEKRGWEIGTDDDIIYPLMKLIGERMNWFVRNMKQREDEDEKAFEKKKAALLKETIRLCSQSVCAKVIKTARTLFKNDQVVDEFDNHPDWFCFSDFKAIEMTTGNVIAITKDDKIITTCGYPLPERDEEYVKMAKAFVSTLVEQGNYDSFMSMMACNFYGDPNKNQKVFIHTGTGGNGKSLMGILLQNVLKNYASVLPIEQLTRNATGRDDANSSMASMRGKRYAQFNEPEDSKETTLKVARVKEISGEPTMKVRDLHKSSFDMKITFTVNIFCNEKPKMSKSDGGIERRLAVFPYVYRFVDEPNEDDPMERQKDDTLGERIKNDKAFQHGFLYLCLDHWRKNEGRFIVGDNVKEANKEYLLENNPVAEWIQGYEESEDFIRIKDLLKVYSRATGTDLSTTSFGRFLTQLKVKVVVDKSNGNKVYLKERPKENSSY